MRKSLVRSINYAHLPLAVSHDCYRRSLAVSHTISVYVGILRVCLRFKPHWMFEIILFKGHVEYFLTSCAALSTVTRSRW